MTDVRPGRIEDASDTLRRAAVRIRELADARPADPPWSRRAIQQHGTCDVCDETEDLVAAYDDPAGENEPWLCAGCAAVADFETVWNPDLAVAFADLLDAQAGLIDFGGAPFDDDPTSVDAIAIRAARVLLGEADQ